MSGLEPLKISPSLAGNPRGKPLYNVQGRLSEGKAIDLVDPVATRALVALMDMAAVIGGAASHYGGPAAFAEMMSALHGLVYYRANQQGQAWYELFHLVNDAGHCENGLYALKANYGQAGLDLQSLQGFRSLQSPLTGHGESHVFPEGVFISNGPLGSGLPQAQGLAMADKLAGVSRVTVTAISDGGCMEGEAREALAAIPGLAAKGQMAPFVLLISDNNTKLSGRIDEESFSMKPTFDSLESLGWKVLKVENGQNIQSCLTAIEQGIDLVLNNSQKPVAIHFKTIKGFGTKATVDSSSGGHGFPLKKAVGVKGFVQEIYGERKVPSEFLAVCDELVSLEEEKKSQDAPSEGVKKEKVQVGVASALVQMRQKGYPVVSITSDLPGSTGVAAFRKNFPVGSFDVGIAESNMVSVAVGMSKIGYIPVVDTFSQFGVTKGALPFLMAALSQGPVIGIFSHAGFQDAADGASHQALSYFSMTHSIPYTETYCLSSSGEAEALVTQVIERFVQERQQGRVPKSVLFFLGRENFPQNYGENCEYKLGKAQVLCNSIEDSNKSVTIVAVGPMVGQALQAVEKLRSQGVGVIVVNASAVNHPDVETIDRCLQKTQGRLLTVEDHQSVGGMGAVLTHALLQEGLSLKVKSLGVSGVFGQSAYTAEDLYAKHGLDAKSIVMGVKSLL